MMWPANSAFVWWETRSLNGNFVDKLVRALGWFANNTLQKVGKNLERDDGQLHCNAQIIISGPTSVDEIME